MKDCRFLYKLLLLLISCLATQQSSALHFTIIESQSYLSTDIMDLKWKNLLTGLGHTATILPQSTLDNTSFFFGL